MPPQLTNEVHETLTENLEAAETFASYGMQLLAASNLLVTALPAYDPAKVLQHIGDAKAALLRAAARLTEFEAVFAAPRPQPIEPLGEQVPDFKNIDPEFLVEGNR